MKRATILLVLLVSWPFSASAQVINLQGVNAFRFEAVPLTARTIATAGTGIGMPDDVTATLTNPAALRLLLRGEVAGSFSRDVPSVPLVTGGTLARNAVGTLVPTQLRFENTQQGGDLGLFTAVAYPMSHLTFAGHWFMGSQHFNDLVMLNESPSSGSSVQLLPGQQDQPRAQHDFYQASLAASVSPTATFGIGGAVVLDHLKVRALLPERVVQVPRPPLPPSVEQRRINAETDGQLRVGYRVGVSWSPTSRVHVGGVYEKGTEHHASVVLEQSFTSIAQLPAAALHLPDQAGLGVGVRVTETLRVTGDVKKVRYSQLKPFLASVLQTAPADETTLDLQDATELRVGTEYIIPFASRAIALRAGFWRDSAHSLVYTGADPLLRAVFTDRLGNQTHVTFGTGIVVRSVEFAGGADVADARRTIIMSTTVRFK